MVFGGMSGRNTGLRTRAERDRYDAVASRVLQGTDAPNCDNEAPRESHVSARTATRYVNPVEEAFGDVSGYIIVVGYKGDLTLQGAVSGESRRRKGIGEALTFRYELRR